MEEGFGSKNDEFVKVVYLLLFFFCLDSRRILICCYDFEHDMDYINESTKHIAQCYDDHCRHISLFYAAIPTILF